MVVDDHGMVREGLAALLDRESDMVVVATAATGRESILAARRVIPDLIIMDLALPDLNGIDAARQILQETPQIRVIALSASHSPDLVQRALRAGARGFALKDAAGRELIIAVRGVLQGRVHLSPGVKPPLKCGDSPSAVPRTAFERLSLRERQVLRGIVEGATSAVIAAQLSLSRKTVDTYRGRLMDKLGVDNRSALIRRALENELIPP